MNLAYGLFMAEAENMFPDERERSIENVVSDLVNFYNAEYDVNRLFKAILKKNNLSNASPREIKRINEEFNRKIS